MLTQEQLRAMRGLQSKASNATVAAAPSVRASAEVENVQAKPNIEPQEIACKNYTDEDGHFAYIDAQTNKIFHVNLDSGKVYTSEEVNYLGLKKATAPLSEELQQLNWQQVVNDKTVYDKFGSPLFTFEEVFGAFERMQQQPTEKNIPDNKPKTDPWGLPLL